MQQLATPDWMRAGWAHVSSWLTAAPDPEPQPQGAGLETAREAMLAALHDGHPAGAAPLALTARLRIARDALSLWHLRGDLSVALARSRGESWAAEEMRSVDRQLQQVLPPGLWQSGSRRAGHPARA